MPHTTNETSFRRLYTSVLRVTLTPGQHVFRLFFKVYLCSALSLKWSRRELSIDVAEHRSALKNNGVVRILVIFQGRPMFRPMFSPIIRMVFARAFYLCD